MPAEILTLLSVFAPAMSAPTWSKASMMLIGALLCRGPRRVTSILRVLGKADEVRFEKYHRVLNRNRWSCIKCAQILLGLLIVLLPAKFPILVVIDETIERRKGKKIKAKGCYRDAVRSTEKKVVNCFGLKWICMALIVPLPWNKRPWALPFLTILAPSKKANDEKGRAHKTTVDWARIMIRLVSRWLKKAWVLVGDGAYACLQLGHDCNQLGVTLISRLRLDSCLYGEPEKTPPGKRGRKPIKGKRITPLTVLANDSEQLWCEAEVAWYGGKKKTVRYLTGVNLWYKSGEKPLRIRWVLVVDPDKPEDAEAFFSTKTTISATKIIEWFVLRWNIEVTFEETRAHLGVETQRQWSDKAIGRTTPVLMGVFSIACLLAKNLAKGGTVKPSVTAWYDKSSQATFADVIASIRRYIWSEKYFSNSGNSVNAVKLTKKDRESLLYLLSEAA